MFKYIENLYTLIFLYYYSEYVIIYDEGDKMIVKIKDIVNELDGFYIISGKSGENNIVSRINVIDAPDVYNWMRGSEFLVTTGYLYKDSPLELKELIIKLSKAKVSGLGIKVGRFIEEIPDEVKELSEELSFPIVYIPNKYAFSEVINPVLSNIVNAQAQRLKISEKIHSEYTKIVVEGRGTEDILDVLNKYLNMDIAYLCFYTNKVYLKATSNDFKNDINKGLKRIIEKFINYEVKIGNTLYGYVVINKETSYMIKDIEQMSIEHAITVLQLDIQKKISNNQIEQRYRDEFISDILMNNIETLEEIRKRGEIYGWVIDKPIFVIVFDLDGFKSKLAKSSDAVKLEENKNNLFIKCRKYMKILYPRLLYTNYSDSIVFLIENPKESDDLIEKIKKDIASVKEKLKELSSLTFSVGIGQSKDVINLNESFKEAGESIKISRAVNGGDNIAYYKELGIYSVLNSIDPGSKFLDICRNYILNVKNYDELKGTEYLKTLKVLIENDWQLKRTSESLFIHYNTMKHRFNKIEEIMGVSLRGRNIRFNIEFSLRFMEIKGLHCT